MSFWLGEQTFGNKSMGKKILKPNILFPQCYEFNMRHKVVKLEIPQAWFSQFMLCPSEENNLITGNKIYIFFWSASNSFWRQQLCSGHEKEKICRNCHLQRWRLHHFRARAHQIYISQVNKSCNFLFLGRYWKVLPFFYSILLLGVFFVMFSWAKYIQNFVFCRLQRPH